MCSICINIPQTKCSEITANSDFWTFSLDLKKKKKTCYESKTD